jgi:hypothetical protein
MTDPSHDLRLSEPVTRHPDSSGGMWGWIAGSAVLLSITITLIAGWHNKSNTASSAPVPPAATTGRAPMAHPATPAKPAIPALPKPGPQ